MDVLPNSNVATFARSGEGNPQPVISKIEDILDQIINALNENRILSIPLRNRRSGNEISVQFPTNRISEVKKFSMFSYRTTTRIFFILSLFSFSVSPSDPPYVP